MISNQTRVTTSPEDSASPARDPVQASLPFGAEHEVLSKQFPSAVLFPLGRILATPGAIDFMERHCIQPGSLLQRHQSGDWGDLCQEDKAENDFSVEHGFRVLSAYSFGPTEVKLWIITEADRSATTLLLPDEY